MMYRTALPVPLPAPWRYLLVTMQDDVISGIEYSKRGVPGKQADMPAKTVFDTLAAYFTEARDLSKVPVSTSGTEFQTRVWLALRDIPLGQTRTYGELAAQLGSGARAVGNACRANPIPLVIPCHRVVAASGEGGFMGRTRGEAMSVKRWLLAHEAHG